MLAAAALATGINYYHKSKNNTSDGLSNFRVETSKNSDRYSFNDAEQIKAVERIRTASQKTNSQFWVGVNGKVIKLLKDDLRGSRHQKFLIRIADDLTLLISHNIDLAKRVPVTKGDTISIRGRYEWNNRGGVIHWTHHDPKGKKAGGWIQAADKVYR